METKQKYCLKTAGILHLVPRRKRLYGIFGNIVRQRDACVGDLRLHCSQKDRGSEPIFFYYETTNNIIHEVRDMLNFILRFLKLYLLL